jgi:UPF0755 protein
MLLATLAALGIGAAAVVYELERPLLAGADSVEVRVTAGSSARAVAGQLAAAGLHVDRFAFIIAATVTRSTHALRAGRYRISGDDRLLDLLRKFRGGEVEPERITIVEGTSFADLRALLARAPDLRHDTADWTEARLMQALGSGVEHAEGLFAPDTYAFDPGTSDVEIYRRAYRAQLQRLDQAWLARPPGLPYTDTYQALIMASIIEKETGRPQERGRIAAVFVNRQRLGMPLQTDPAVIYGLGDKYDGRLHKRDLLLDTPYNTYTRTGLPPTPISLPGRAAIEAALRPDPDKALYFVARGDGSSEFSETLAEHNRAVDRYRRAELRTAAP